MTTEDSTSKFLELEESASRLLDELERLRQETSNYEQASSSLESIGHDVRGLVTSLGSAAEQLQVLVAGLRDIGMPELLDKVASLEGRLIEATNGIKETQRASTQSVEALRTEMLSELAQATENSNQLLDSLIEYHSRGVLGKLFGKPRPTIKGQ